MSKERLNWLDLAKGMAISLVILGHMFKFSIWPTGEVVVGMIYSFHMPLFFVLSGWFSKVFEISYCRSKVIDYLSKRFIRLILHGYFFWGAVNFIYQCIVAYIKSDMGISRHITDTLLISTNSIIAELWFFPCLYMAEVLIIGLKKYIKSNNNLFTVLTVLMLIEAYIIPSDNVPFCIYNLFTAAWFIFVGRVIKEKFQKIKFTSLYFLCSLIALFIANISNLKISGIQVAFWKGEYGLFPLFLITALSGIYCILFIAIKMQCSKMFELLGKYSMHIYGSHFIILTILFKLFNRINISNLYIASICIFILTFVILKTVYIVIGYLQQRNYLK